MEAEPASETHVNLQCFKLTDEEKCPRICNSLMTHLPSKHFRQIIFVLDVGHPTILVFLYLILYTSYFENGYTVI
jgi:hypothetical protein